MSWRDDTMISPPIEELLGRVDSKFSLVTLAARRAREVNSYYHDLTDGLGLVVPPQVTTTARKPLSIAFEEIGADKITGSWYDADEREAAEAAAAADAAAALDAES